MALEPEVHRAEGAVAAITHIIIVWAYTKVTDSVGWSENDEDYAVLVTSFRIGERFGNLGVRTYNSSWDGDRHWWSMDYTGDKGERAGQRRYLCNMGTHRC